MRCHHSLVIVICIIVWTTIHNTIDNTCSWLVFMTKHNSNILCLYTLTHSTIFASLFFALSVFSSSSRFRFSFSLLFCRLFVALHFSYRMKSEQIAMKWPTTDNNDLLTWFTPKIHLNRFLYHIRNVLLRMCAGCAYEIENCRGRLNASRSSSTASPTGISHHQRFVS